MPETAILRERLERFLDPNVHLRAGAGNGVSVAEALDQQFCINQAADWRKLAGELRAKALECLDAVLTTNHERQKR